MGQHASDPTEGVTRSGLRHDWVDFAQAHGFIASHFLTLTFDEDRTGRVVPERALVCWRGVVRSLNKWQWGHRFERKYGRSSFSYIAAVDYSELGAVHLHIVVDGFLPYSLLHSMWNDRFGFAWVEPVDTAEDNRVALAHVTKYSMKAEGALVDFFFARIVVRARWTNAERGRRGE